MKVLFDYRTVRKTRNQPTTMIELDTFLRNEEKCGTRGYFPHFLKLTRKKIK